MFALVDRGSAKSERPVLHDEAWRSRAPLFIVLLSDDEGNHLADTYTMLGGSQAAIDLLYGTGPDKASEATLNLWAERADEDLTTLRRIEKRGRWLLAAWALVGVD